MGRLPLGPLARHHKGRPLARPANGDARFERRSAVLRRDVSEARAERRNILEAVGEMNARLRRRTFRDGKPRPPLCRGANGPRLEAAAAIRADIVELALDAVDAEGAFVRADAGERGVRRQITVAPLAIRSKLQSHVANLFSAKDYRRLQLAEAKTSRILPA